MAVFHESLDCKQFTHLCLRASLSVQQLIQTAFAHTFVCARLAHFGWESVEEYDENWQKLEQLIDEAAIGMEIIINEIFFMY
jgi:hypothetical protein